MTEQETTTVAEETTTTTTEVTAEATEQQGAENVEEVNAVNSATEEDEQLIDPYAGYKPMATTAPEAGVDGEAAKQLITQLQDENRTLIEQVNALTTQLTTVNQILEHPTLLAAKALIEKGEDATTSKFIEVARMSNPHTMSVDDVYERQTRDFFTKKGFKGEELNEKVLDALDRFTYKDDIEKETIISTFREKLIADFDQKTQEYLGVTETQRQANQQQQKVFIENANAIQAEIERIAKAGSFGIFQVNNDWVKQAQQVNLLRHDKDGRIDVVHAMKVINYAINPDAVEKELIRLGKRKITPEVIQQHATKQEKDMIAEEKKVAATVKNVYDAMDEALAKRRNGSATKN